MNKNLLLVFFNQSETGFVERLLLLETEPFKLTPIDDLDLQRPEKVDRVIAVVSASMVSSLLREVPPKQIKYLAKTLPFLVEDDLIAPIDSLHIVSQSVGDSRVRVFAIDHGLMQSFISWAEGQGLKFDGLYVDADLIALNENTPQGRVINGGDYYLIKAADAVVAQIDRVTKINNVEQLDNFTFSDMESCEDYQRFVAEAICRETPEILPPINLLQGYYAPRASLAERSALVHRVIFAASILLLVQVFYWVILGADYKVEAQQLREKSTEIYQQYFPSEKTIIDIRSQAEGHLNQVVMPQDKTPFLTVLETVAEAIRQHSLEADVLVKSIQYRKQAGDFILEISAPNVAVVEQLRIALADGSYLNVQTEQINQSRDEESSESGISARLRISNSVSRGVK